MPLPRPLRWPATFAFLLLGACAGPDRQSAPPAPPAVSIAIAPQAVAPPLVVGGDAGFQAFIRDFEATAIAAGVTPETYAKAVAGIAPITTLSDIIAEQPEFVRPIWTYLDGAASARRIADAKLMLAQNAPLLDKIEKDSGVPREILVAVWGMETDYGRDTGSYNIFAALASQAYEGARQGLARREMIAALQIMQQNNYEPAQMVSSWAGAFGQTQFMPTTFFKYAADGDGDGRIDLWRSTADALASAANLFQREGWQPQKPWAVEVKLPPGFAYQDADLSIEKPLSQWRALGVHSVTGAELPEGEDSTALYLPAGSHGGAFLTFANFRMIMKYNNAGSYALAVGLLADRMMGRPGIITPWPRKEKLLDRTQRLRFQADLAALGYETGPADGLLGRRVRAALRQWQLTHGLVADGYPTMGMLEMLDSAVKRQAENSGVSRNSASR